MVQYSNVNEIEVAVTKTEIFRINSNEDFVELKGYPLPDSRFHYGSRLITSLDK